MKELIALTLALILLNSCQFKLISKSDCFGGRLIVDEIEELLRFDITVDSVFIDENQRRYFACNYPDNLLIGQFYNVKLRLLRIEETEKWVGQPCEIKEIEISKSQF